MKRYKYEIRVAVLAPLNSLYSSDASFADIFQALMHEAMVKLSGELRTDISIEHESLTKV